MSEDRLEYRFEPWLREEEISNIDYSTYWNDVSNEKGKAWWITDGDFEKMEKHLQNTGLVLQLEASLKEIERLWGYKLHGVGCDLAAGNLWAESHLLRLGAIEHIYCVEFSSHRLLTLGPSVLTHYKVPTPKVTLVLGDFTSLRISDNSLDFIFMSQAFHHAEYPDQVLREIKRTLKQQGFAIIIGEHINDLSRMYYLRQLFKFMLAKLVPRNIQQKLFGRIIKAQSPLLSPQDISVADPILGDHHYMNKQYETMFFHAGFEFHVLRDVRFGNQQCFILRPNS